MKILRYLLPGLLVALIIAVVVVHWQRDQVGRAIANKALADSGLTVTTLSVAAVSDDELRLRRITLQNASGTVFDLFDVRAPLQLPSVRLSRVEIDRAAVEFAETDGESTDLRAAFNSALSLPASIPELDVSIGELAASGYPRLQQVHWQTADGSQQLGLDVGGLKVNLVNHGLPEFDINLAVGDEEFASAHLAVQENDDGASINADFEMQAQAAMRVVADLIAALPGELDVLGRFKGELAMTLVDGKFTAVALQLQPLADSRIDYQPPDQAYHVSSNGASDYAFQLDPATAEWAFSASSFELQVQSDLAKSVVVQVERLACRNSGVCVGPVAAVIELFAVDGISAQSVQTGGVLTITPGDEIQASLAAKSLSVMQTTGADWSIKGLRATQPTEMTVRFVDTGFVVNIGQAAVSVDGLQAMQAARFTGPIQLSDLSYVSASTEVETRFSVQASDTQLQWDTWRPVMPKLDGRVSYKPDNIYASFTAQDEGNSLDSKIRVGVRPSQTSVEIVHANFDFGSRAASRFLKTWPWPWDLIGGTAKLSGEFEWQPGQESSMPDGSIELDAAGLAIRYNDIVATGVQATLASDLSRAAGFVTAPAMIAADLLEVGFPISDISSTVRWGPDSHMAYVDALAMQALGGRISAEAFQYNLAENSAAASFELEELDLARLREMWQLEGLSVSGRVSGRVPATLRDGKFTVAAGRIEAVQPGGTMKYLFDAGGSVDSSVSMAMRALSNFQYESLLADAEYTDAGDLILGMRIKGTNPDVDPLQPVILNLTIENNIPQLLRSLQAARDVQSVLGIDDKGQ